MLNYFLLALSAVSSLPIDPSLTIDEYYPSFVVPMRPESDIYAGNSAYRDIQYTLGNPVLTGDVNVYYIYYGNWNDSQMATLEHFMNNIGSSGWYGINRKYYYQADIESPRIPVSGSVTLKKTVVDLYSRGKKLSGYDLPELIQEKIDANELPEDTSAVYFVLTAGDVMESIRPDLGRASFCSSYCGYHVSWELTSGKRIYYAQVGLPTRCLSGCAATVNSRVSPNGDSGVDGMLSALAHELVEAVSDPVSDIDSLRAWQDATGYENGDKCAVSFGL
jgi:hypothetical protein